MDFSKYGNNYDALLQAIKAQGYAPKFDDNTPDYAYGNVDGKQFSAAYSGLGDYNPDTGVLDPTTRPIDYLGFHNTGGGQGTAVSRNPDGSIGQTQFGEDGQGMLSGFLSNPAFMLAAAPLAAGALSGGFGGAAGAGGTGAFDLGGISGGVAGAGGETGLGSAFGLGSANLPTAADLAAIGDGNGFGGSFAHTAADATGEAGASGFSDAGFSAANGLDPAYVGSGTASNGFQGALRGANNFLGSGIGRLIGSAAPGALASLFSKGNNVANPDYVGAANAQGAANSQAALNSSQLSNPNINTPYGSQTVTYGADGNPYHATINQTLSPAQQALFDQQNNISRGMGNLAQGSIGQVANSLSQPFNQNNLPPPATSGGAGWQHAFDSIIRRNQPLMDRDQAALNTRLANQGIFGGSEAYSNAQKDEATKVNDFRLGAQQNAQQQEQSQFGIDSQARQDAITQQNFFRQQPLNELNSLRSGSQVTNPTFQQYQGTTAAPAPVFAGQQAQGLYNQNQTNAQTASSNALTSGLFSLGAAGLSAPKNTFSNLFSFGGN
jgi:hypothetical protein